MNYSLRLAHTVPLTTDVDNGAAFTGGAGNDTFTGNSTTFTTGDQLDGGAGTDTLNLNATSATNGVVELTNAENVNIRIVSTSSVDASLWAGVQKISVEQSSVMGTALTVTNADISSTISVAGDPSAVTVSFNNASGTADTAALSLTNVGGSTSATGGDVDITLSGAETVNIATSGTNYIDLAAGTGAAKINVTGSGTNFIDIESAATSVAVDGSAATGALDLDIGATLTNGDVLKAGATTTDKLTAGVASTATNAPTINGFETLALTLSAAVNLDMTKVTDVTTITLADSAVAQRLSNVPGTVTSIASQETSTSANDIRVDYVTGAAATLALAFSPSATSTANVTWDDITVSNVANLTLSASGAYQSTIDDVAGGTALIGLTIKTSAASGDFAVGKVTARNIETVEIAAVAGDITLEDLDNDAYATLKSLKIDASSGADVTITNALDLYEATDETSSLEVISIVGGAESVIAVGDIDAAGAATDEGPAVAITVSLDEDSGGSDIGAITVVGVASVAITLSENAGIASKVGLITAEAGDVGNISITVNDDAILEFDGVTADEGDIGDISITTVKDGAISDIAGGDVAITSTKGDIGAVNVVSGNGGTVELQVTAAAGSIGAVTVTSNADDEIYLAAEQDIGNVTMTVALGDTLTTIIDGSTIGNVSVTGAGDGSVTVRSSDAQGAATATTGNITVSLTDAAAVGSTVNLSDVGSAGTVAVTGGAGDDTLTGAASASSVSGGAGADTIVGGDGADTLVGGDGADDLTGDAGADSLSGGAGDDEFIMTAVADFASGETVSGGTGTDTITFGAAGTISFEGRVVTAVETLTLTAGANNAVTLTQGTGIATVNNLVTANDTLELVKATTNFESAAEASAAAVDIAGEWFLDATDPNDAVLTYYDEELEDVVSITLVGALTGVQVTAAATNGDLILTVA
jgi:hypothetical protein